MKNALIALAVSTTVALPATASTLTDTYTSYYAFGDSLTDDGKFGALFPPSLGGRFSNGETYAEHVENEFIAADRDTGNLALGGATGGPINARPEINFIPLATFAGQIAVFANALANGVGLPVTLPTNTNKPEGPEPGSNPLVSVLFGGNDFFQGFDVVAAADAVAQGIRDIAALEDGVVFDDFLVLDLPDVGGSPAFSTSAAASAAATAATNAYNARLFDNVEDLRDEGLNILYFDSSVVFDELLNDIRAGNTSSGITNVDGACTASLSDAGPSCLDLGLDPDSFAFADGVHPSGAVHSILGEAVLAELNTSVAPVPLPATLPLAVFALGAMGWAGRRRKA